MQHIGKTKNSWQVCWENILDYIFPKECFGCAKEGEYLCSACFDKIIYLEDERCYLCNDDRSIDGVCSKCSKDYAIDQIIVATKYQNNFVGQLVESLKYQYVEELGKILAQILNKQIQRKNFTSRIYNHKILPVPLHKKRYLERGFNQSELIARYLINKYNCQLVNDLVIRSKETQQQAKLNREERFLNIKDCFCLSLQPQIPETVIILDDVITTGATVSGIAKVLKDKGVKRVIALAVCHD